MEDLSFNSSESNHSFLKKAGAAALLAVALGGGTAVAVGAYELHNAQPSVEQIHDNLVNPQSDR